MGVDAVMYVRTASPISGADLVRFSRELVAAVGPRALFTLESSEYGHLSALARVKNIRVAIWLEANVPGAAVWYGGDSSGVCAAPFGQPERLALLRHFAEREGVALGPEAACVLRERGEAELVAIVSAAHRLLESIA